MPFTHILYGVAAVASRRARVNTPLLTWIAVIAITVAGAACGKTSTPSPVAPTPTPTPTATVTSVSVTSAPTGATFQLAASARLSDGSALDVTQTAVWD